MSVINKTDYTSLALQFTYAYTSMLNIPTFVYAAVVVVVGLDDVEQEVDLLNPVYQSYQNNVNTFSSPSTLLQAVAALQQHVLRRYTPTVAGAPSIDDYLTQSPVIKVSSEFAALSALAGYPIAPANQTTESWEPTSWGWTS